MALTLEINEKLEQIVRENRSQIITQYQGIFDQNVVRDNASLLNKTLKKYVITQRRMFYVFVELGQNIGYYSDERAEKNEKNTGVGSLIIYENNENVGFILCNKINNKALSVLERKCRIINTMDREELREYKRHQRNLIPGTNGGAHIGLIMVALTTRKKLDVKTIPIDDDFSYFVINVKMKKE